MISEPGGKTLDLAFIDGMQQIEFALRAFIDVIRARPTEVKFPPWPDGTG